MLPPTYNYNLQIICHSIFQRYFRTTEILCILPTGRVHQNKKSDIVNLDNVERPDIHWMEYAKRGNYEIYFDSFDNFRSPKDMQYLENNVTQIKYKRTHHQRYDQSNYGQLLCPSSRILLFRGKFRVWKGQGMNATAALAFSLSLAGHAC